MRCAQQHLLAQLPRQELRSKDRSEEPKAPQEAGDQMQYTVHHTEPPRMSPLALKVLLHYYTTPLQFDKNVAHDLEIEAIQGFIRDGLVTQRDGAMPPEYDTYVITDRGTAYCEAIVNLPLPESIWVIPK